MKACGCISLQSGAILIGLFKIIVYSIAISLTLLLAFTGLSVTQLKDRAFEKAQLLLKSDWANNSQIPVQFNSTTAQDSSSASAPVPLPVPAPISVLTPENSTTPTTTAGKSGNANNTQRLLPPEVNQNQNQTAPILPPDEKKLTEAQQNFSQISQQENDKILRNLNELTDENLLMILGVDLLLNLFGIICSIVLVLGAHNGNFCTMNLWIFIDILLLLAAITLTVMTSNLFDLNLSPQILLTTGSTFSYSIYLLPLDLYFLLVVFFYQREIKASRNQLPF